DDFREFVNPMIALRARLAGEPTEVPRVDAGRLMTREGQVVEDFHGTQAFGHRNPAITRAVRAFLESDSPSWFPSRVNPYAGSLARRLCERANGTGDDLSAPYSNVYLANSGSEAVEAALKLARAVTRRPRVLSLEGAYHGCTMGSCGLMSKGVFRDPFEPHLPGLEALPFGDVTALRVAVERGDVAAVVVEPIQLEGGVRPLPRDYVDALCELTRAHQVLLVADEIQTGLGRTGRFLASEIWPRRPDAVLLGKHLGGGLLPISAMLTRRDLFERAYGKNFETAEAHNCTFSGSAAVCVAAHAALDLLSGALVTRVAELGSSFRSSLSEALADLPLFREVRGDGLAVGIALERADHPWLSFEHFGMDDLAGHPSVGLLLCHRLYKRGFFCFVCGHDWSVLRLQPRFTIEPERLAEFTSIVREELLHLCALT
ncbi:MAG TPA: aminotransferase class III-fold pyridoxal phosphate-dependent enzyme, partial [Polyangiaceae bacterium]|nr:aminotransferase class III-fold pyridoxal phosphate-dependent enzyme [Polyangiaceae bacterium]